MAIIARDRTASSGLRREPRTGYVTAGMGYHWVAAALALMLTGGLYLDGWAHNHGRVDNTFFTPWHAFLYGSMALTAVMLVGTMGRLRGQGYAWTRVLPRGYGLSLFGVVLFGIGGVGDLIWHTLFGFEANIEALLSPTHLVLATAGFLIVSGPLRALALNRSEDLHGWRNLGPAVLSAVGVLSLLSFFTEFAHPLVRAFPSQAYVQNEVIGIAGVLLQAVLLAGVVLALLRRWELPLGSLTLIIAVNAVLVSVLNDTWALVPAIMAAGVLCDLAVWVIKPRRAGWRQSLTAFCIPFIYFAMYFAEMLAASRVAWSIHLWLGSIFMAGIAGVLLSLIAPFEAGRLASPR